MVFSVLCVCTANICRSPMMDVSLQRLTAGNDIVIASAGSRGRDGREADPITATVAAEFGLDLSAHRSQPLTREVVQQADLIVCAEVEHLLAVIDKDASAFPKTFLLLELAERATPRRDNESLQQWVDRHHQGRSPAALLKSGAALGLPDPYKQGADKIRKAASQVVTATAAITSAWR
jgi:protein-tyrosine-phosphatase